MAAIAKYNAGASAGWVAALTAALNGLTTGSSAISAAISNDAAGELDLLMDVSIRLGSITPSGSPYLDIHVLPLLDDGATYADIGSATYAGSIPVSAGASAKNGMLQGIALPPGDFKLGVVNNTGQTLAGAGNTAAYRTYDYNLNG